MRSVDIHNHWYPDEWVELVIKEGEANNAKITKNERGQFAIQAPGMTYAFAFRKPYSDLDMRLKAMDATGVDVHAVSLAVPFVYWAPPEFALKLARVYNDNLSAAHRQHPDRLVGLATLPMQAPQLAVQELERAAKLPGIRGVCMATNINGMNLDDKSLWPVYANCEELDLPIFLHSPMNPVGAERMRNYHLRNLLGNPYEEGIAGASLIFGGVMDAYPKLNIVFSHAGGALPGLVGRMDHGAAVRPESKLPKPPSHYARRFYYDIITHSDLLLVNLIRQMGAERIVLGSDHPADMGYTRPAEVVERLTEISASDRDLIIGGNAARLLKL